MELGGLHHVTAITAKAADNLAFYTQVLGLRLVKKTVNQDDTSAYHLFYADAVGSPGTDLTFFDWPHIAQNRHGAGSIAEIALRVPDQTALEYWAKRLSQFGVPYQDIVREGEQEILRFVDPEGQPLALVNDHGAPESGMPWSDSPVPGENFIGGLHSVKLMVRELEPTAWVLTDVMGFRLAREYPSPVYKGQPVFVYEVGRGGSGTQVHVEAGDHLPNARQGYGGVHHVAFRTPNEAAQRQWRQRISEAGLRVTPIIDRFYFKSIYFREPGGILYEIATDGPGFTADEEADNLGKGLALPPFLEPKRDQIEAALNPLAT